MDRLQQGGQRYYQRPDAPHIAARSHARPRFGLERQRQPEQEQRERHRQRRACGASARASSPTTPGFATQADRGGAHGDRAVAQAHAGRAHPHAPGLGVEVVDVQLRRRVAGRRRAVGGQPPAPELLAVQPQPGPLVGHAGRQADARRAHHDPPRHPEPERVRGHATAGGGSGSARTAPRSSATSATGTARSARSSELQALGRAHAVGAARSYSRVHSVAQYLATVPGRDGHRDLRRALRVRDLDQREVAMPLRVNLVLSPRLSVQL